MLVAQLPLVAVVVLVLVLYMERRFSNVERRLGDVVRCIGVLVDFNEVLLGIQVLRGSVSDSEYRALAALLSSARPVHSSRYYTKEVYERLGELLRKDPNELTWDDVFELERIYELLLKEAEVSGRSDLVRYAGKLRVLIAMAKGFLLKRGVLPPPGRVV